MEKSFKKWARLDNAALIFPASKRRGWFNRYRISVTLTEEVDPDVLQSALEVCSHRFPLIVARLRRGFFWYYLENVDHAPRVREDGYQPLMAGSFSQVKKSAISVLYYRNRIAVEFFHSVTDGGGGQVFVRNLLAEYLTQKYHLEIPCEYGIVDRKEKPRAEELEDSHLRYRGRVALSRKEGKAWHIRDEKEPDGFNHLTCGTMSASQVHDKAKEYHTTVTIYLTAVLLEALLALQKEKVRRIERRRPVRVQIPVNLRKLLPSQSLRNFVYIVNVGVDPRMGDYTFEELIEILGHQFGLQVTPKNMQGAITTNVNSEKMTLVRIVPLGIKNIIMKAVYDTVGETQACIGFSNLGMLELPEVMRSYVEDFDFIISPQAESPNNCSACSFGDHLRMNFIRNSVSPELERLFFTNLVKKGIHVRVDSNERNV